MFEFEIDEAIEKASTPPSRFYKDPAVFEETKNSVFARSWQFIGDAELAKVPGAVYPLTLLEGCLDEPLVLTRDTNDNLNLVSNVCTHRGNLVVEGAGNERFLRCRYHGRRFGLDGCFQSMPEFEGVCGFPSEADHLAKVPFGHWGPFLFASVNPSVAIETALKPMMDRVGWLPLDDFRHDPQRSKDYLVRGNWALYVDNFLEGFHIPFIHASLNQVIDYDNYTFELYDHLNLQLAGAKSGDDHFDLPLSSPDHGKDIAAYYYWLFPNTMFNFYPWGLSINVVKPLAHDLTRVSFICYVWDESRLGKGAGAALDRVEREDEAIIELVQKGVQSRFYDRGRYSPTKERGTHHFHRLLAAAMRG